MIGMRGRWCIRGGERASAARPLLWHFSACPIEAANPPLAGNIPCYGLVPAPFRIGGFQCPVALPVGPATIKTPPRFLAPATAKAAKYQKQTQRQTISKSHHLQGICNPVHDRHL
jgi:hypothetical protein